MTEDNGITGDQNSHLLYFYGTECTHCHEMDPLHQKLADEEGLKLKKLEMWHNARERKILRRIRRRAMRRSSLLLQLKYQGFYLWEH